MVVVRSVPAALCGSPRVVLTSCFCDTDEYADSGKESPARGHTASKLLSWDSNPGPSDPDVLIPELCGSQSSLRGPVSRC